MTRGSAGRDLVSVVIGTRDRSALLLRTLQTVLSQTHEDLEVLVVDDGSVDDTAEVLAAHPDDRVHLIQQPSSGGVARARNAGLAHARGAFIAFTDDDDLWAPHKVERQVQALGSHPPAEWCCSSTVVVDPHLRPVQWQPAPTVADIEGSLLEVNVVPGGASGVLATAELMRRVGGFDAAFRHFADWDLWIRLGAASPLAAVHSPVLAYLRHDSMSNVAAFKYDDMSLMESRYRERRRELAVPSPVGHNLHWIGLTALRSGDVTGAVRAYRAAASEPTGRHSRLWAGLARLPGFLTLYDMVKSRAVPAEVRGEVEPWLAPLRGLPSSPAGTAAG